nr:immunoglobulin heavy chain junction region [Mus musculus]
ITVQALWLRRAPGLL